MISDVLSDAVSEIKRYLDDEPDYAYAEEIKKVCFVMDAMRGLLDTSPSNPADYIAAKEEGLRQLLLAVPEEIQWMDEGYFIVPISSTAGSLIPDTP